MRYVPTVLALLAATNLFSFVLMGLDKRRARCGAWRIPEKVLLLSSACFGALGGMAGMLAFRHKTQHARFAILLPLFLAAQVVLVVLLLRRLVGGV